MKSAASFLALSAALAIPAGVALAKAPAAPATAAQYGPQGDYPVTVGDPFVVDGVTYTPADTMNYDAVGYAAQGSNGGVSNGVSGAHRTLPVPSYVEVTSLDTGHTALVRIDRRGPMTGGDRLIELSPAAWAQLGIAAADHAAVRVRRVNPPEQERALLRTGQVAPLRMDTPPGLLSALKRKLGIVPPPVAEEPAVKPVLPSTRPTGIPVKPVARPTGDAPKPLPKPAPAAKPTQPAKAAPPAKPAPAPTAQAVQVGAFSTRERAEKAAAQVGGSVSPAGKFFRVRIGAASTAQAQAALAKARRAGYADARIVRGQ